MAPLNKQRRIRSQILGGHPADILFGLADIQILKLNPKTQHGIFVKLLYDNNFQFHEDQIQFMIKNQIKANICMI